MKKLITITSALFLAGGVSYAMEEGEGDEMMMEAPAPSVSLGGSASIGFDSVSGEKANGKDHDNDGINLVREYKVSFSSSGTTDGGLMFGAGISIEDTHDDDPGNAVNGAKVFVGGADGSWKLQLGGNDPGIEVVSGIGVADDHFDGGNDKTIGLMGSFGGAEYRITMADPQAGEDDDGNKTASDGDWSAGAKYGIGDVNVGFGMDSESGLAISVGTDVSGVGLGLYYSTSDESDYSLNGKGNADSLEMMMMNNFKANKVPGPIPSGLEESDYAFANAAQLDIDDVGKVENTGIGVSASIPAGEGASLSVAYSKNESEHSTAAKAWFSNVADARGEEAKTNVTGMVEAEKTRIGISFSYDLGGGATFNAGVEKDETETTYSISSNGETKVLPKDGATAVENQADSVNDKSSLSQTHETDKTTLSASLSFSF